MFLAEILTSYKMSADVSMMSVGLYTVKSYQYRYQYWYHFKKYGGTIP